MILVIHCFAVWADEKFYEPRPSLPIDMRLALSHLQYHHPTQREQIKKNIVVLDQYLDLLSEEERLFITKAELYKALFRVTRNAQFRIELFEERTIDVVTRARQESIGLKETHPFFFQLYGSILSDLNTTIQAPGYRSFLNKLRSSQSQLNSDELMLKRKLEMILPWVEWFQKGGIDQVNFHLILALDDYLNVLVSRLNDYFFLTTMKLPNLITSKEGDLSFFSLKPYPSGLTPSPMAKVEDSATIESILAPILNQQVILPKPVDDWKPKESAEEFFLMQPDPSYVAPEVLPAPVNDWIQGL